MSSNSIQEKGSITVRSVSKAFQIFKEPHHRLLGRKWRQRMNYEEEVHALANVNLEVSPGEVVGIVGRNGSGKSTLLQIISGTMSPSSGEINVIGRVAALLELGAGFNQEYTGIENVRLNAAVLGLTKIELEEQLSAILEFAEIGEFIDRPIKTYSSGMLVRLAFSVAICVKPDVLIIDEALAVGDERFQRKCYARIDEMKKSGVTILFVTHSSNTIVEICDRALLMEGGRSIMTGSPKEVVGIYQRLLYADEDEVQRISAELEMRSGDVSDVPKSPTVSSLSENLDYYDPNLQSESIAYPNYGATISHVKLMNCEGESVNYLRRGGEYVYQYRVRFSRECVRVRYGMMIKSISGVELGGSSSDAFGQSTRIEESSNVVDVRFQFSCKLNPGHYFLNAGVLGLLDGEEGYLARLLDAMAFKVVGEKSLLSTGYIDFDCLDEVCKREGRDE